MSPRSGRAARKQYPNRSDLRVPKDAPTGQPYGERKKQIDSQEKLPVAPPPSLRPQLPPQGSPPVLSPFSRPTERPGEPLTAGLTGGAGPGPEALDIAPVSDPTAMQLRAIYARFPNEDLRQAIELIDDGSL